MAVHGKNLYFAVEDSAGSTLRDLSADLNSVNVNRGNDVHDKTTYGQTGHRWAVGLTNGTVTIAGFYSVTALTGTQTVLASLLGTDIEVAWEYGPEGDASGKPKESGSAVLVSFDKSAPVADLVSFTATFNISGAVTDGTFSA